MIIRRSSVVVFVFSTLLYLESAAAPPAAMEDYLGNWEIVLADTGTTFRSSSLALTRTNGQFQGEVVWRWGSAMPLEEKDVKLGGGGELFVSVSDWKHPLVLRRVGDALEGVHEESDGKKFTVFATRRRERADPAGTWDLRVLIPDNEATGTLIITEEGAGQILARGMDSTGAEARIDEARIEGNALTIRFASPKDGSDLPGLFVAEVRGDQLEGKVTRDDPEKSIPVKGVRRRTWGKPVRLLAEKGLEGWEPRDPAQKFGWSCEGGILTNSPPDVDIVSRERFRDFKLHLEYKVSKGGNSGVYLRGRYEVQILDDYHPTNPKVESHGNGAVYSRIPQKKNVSRAPETWQTYDITLIDRYVTVVLNGETVIDNARLDGITGGALLPFEAEPGPLMLQGDHGKVSYRNISVSPALQGARVVEGERKSEPGFVQLFPADGIPGGWNVRAWNDVKEPAPGGAAWRVEKGVLHGSEPRGTWLVSEAEYGDFMLDFEWKVGDQGNSGCGLRFPPRGDPAFDGLELQMVDPRYYPPEQAVTPGELTGSLYKAVAPSAQVFKPGDWNKYEVTCQGSKVKVALNGQAVLDVDLDKDGAPVKRHDGSDAPPLKDRPRRGHIGFQELSRGGGHVEIRNARVKAIN